MKFYTNLGRELAEKGRKHNVPLDEYIEFFQNFCSNLKNVDKLVLRDTLVMDRLAVNSTGRLPKCLYKSDEKLAKSVKFITENPQTAPKKATRRGIALLYSENSVCWVDYESNNKNPVTNRWELNLLSLDDILS